MSSEVLATGNFIIDTIVDIHNKIPLAQELILKMANKHNPYYKKHPQILLLYAKALLILGERLPDTRYNMLEIVVHR